MNQQDTNLKIAEADGWTLTTFPPGLWQHPDEQGARYDPPSYTGPSGDPIRAAVARMTESQQLAIANRIYREELWEGSLEKKALAGVMLASPMTLCLHCLRVKLNDPQLVIYQP